MKQMSDSRNSHPTAFMNHVMKLSNKTQVDNPYVLLVIYGLYLYNCPFFPHVFKYVISWNIPPNIEFILVFSLTRECIQQSSSHF